MSLKILMMGTADFALPSLEALAAAGHDIRAVVCQPDRKRGRGHKMQSPPLKQKAEELGLQVLQPENAKDPGFLEEIRALDLDLGVVVAYGQILTQEFLDLPRLGCINLHGSLLPRWRGAAPVHWAIAEGDAQTGVSVQRMVKKLDAGDVLAAKKVFISEFDDSEGLLKKLAPLGAQLLVSTIEALESGQEKATPQDETQATLAPMLCKEHGRADFSLDAKTVARHCRAFQQRPGFRAWLQQGREELRLYDLKAMDGGGGKPGELLSLEDGGWRVACRSGTVMVSDLQSAGGRRMKAIEWARGHGVKPGMLLGGETMKESHD